MCFFCVAAAAAVKSPAPAVVGGGNFIVANFVAPVLFTFLGFNVYSYGILMACALGLACWVLERELKKSKIDLDIYNIFLIFLAGFAVGSKSHVTLSAMSAGEPLTWKALDIRNNHSFMGSAIGGVGSLVIYVLWNKVGVLKFLDSLLPCVILGHVVGKVGCFVSGDGCYGPPADPLKVPWAMSFPNGAEPTRIPVHPTPIYEGVASLLVFTIVMLCLPLPAEGAKGTAAQGPRPGRRTALTLVLYGIERAVCEEFRRHPSITIFGGITEYQALAVVFLFIGLALEAWGRLSGRSAGKGKNKNSKKKAEAPAEEIKNDAKPSEQKKEKKKDSKKKQ